MENSNNNTNTMPGSGLEKEINTFAPPPIRVRHVFFMLGLFMVLGIVLGGIAVQLLQTYGGWDASVIAGIVTTNSSPEDLWKVRILAGLNQVLIIMLPAVLTLIVLRRYILKDTGLGHWPALSTWATGVLLMTVATPLVLWVFEWNKMIPMPTWMEDAADRANTTIKAIMQMPSLGTLAANLFLIAVIPAIGEELLFRGLIQRQLMRKVQPWIAIIVTGALFSLFHFQMDGFFPRWLMGILLGWIYWKSENLWVPIIVHFFNNGVQVIAQYFYNQRISAIDLEQDVHVPIALVLVSLAGTWWLMRNGYRIMNKKTNNTAKTKEELPY